ncbi:MAG: DNA repair protein [Planctomycetota bacterium]
MNSHSRGIERSKSGQTIVNSPNSLRSRLDKLQWTRDQFLARQKQLRHNLEEINSFLGIADQVTEALDQLSQKLFERVLGILQSNLSIALQEVLEQPIEFKAEASFRRGTACVDFMVARDGNLEDIRLGQGGSVQNVLSVGLRLFALASLEQDEHRRFLVLDEQDCWLRPELVPKLVNIVHRAAKELDFQVIMISHHDIALFEEYADRIYRFEPADGAVNVELVRNQPLDVDSESER